VYREVLGADMHLTPALHRPGQACLADGHRLFSAAALAAAGVHKGADVLQLGGGWGALARQAITEHGCKCDRRTPGLRLDYICISPATEVIPLAQHRGCGTEIEIG